MSDTLDALKPAKADEWQHLILSGQTKRIQVKNPVFDKGILQSIEGMIPIRLDEDGKEIEATLDFANTEKRKLYIEFFKKSFKNLLILSGAGSSMDVKGPSMWDLWVEVKTKYQVGDEDGLKIICDTVNHQYENKDLEALLSRIDGYAKFVVNAKITLNGNNVDLSIVKTEIFKIIKKRCSLDKPAGNFPHKIFLEKVLQRKQTNPRVKIFTLNYDLLFEHAATEVNAIVIDGFSFNFPRTFSGRFFDYDIVQREGSKLQEEDNFIQRVFHLHKLHGSLNWEADKSANKIIVKDNTANPLMVYPREAKYEDSYEQPFFEMMARFQRSLRINNDTLLICIGYSFNDKHINAAIEEALNQNPSFRLAVIDPMFDGDKTSACLKSIKAEALYKERITMISETFTDFAQYFPEIQTYEYDINVPINLSNART